MNVTTSSVEILYDHNILWKLGFSWFPLNVVAFRPYNLGYQIGLLYSPMIKMLGMW